MSEPEVLLWSTLRRFPYKFRRQEPIGRYIADFCCYEARLIVEVDGDRHLNALEYDRARDAYMAGLGFQVVRIPAGEVMSDIHAVADYIASTATERAAFRQR